MADEAPVDRLSSLPESLISDILSYIPTKEAVATSILSRSWRFRWTKITSFHFDNTREHFNKDDDSDEYMDFAEFIDSVLLKHSGDSFNCFFLVWESATFRPEHLYKWADIAIARNVRVLSLETVTKGHPFVSTPIDCEFELPSSLYTCGSLEFLKLEGPFLIKPPNVVCLPNLLFLRLTEVIYESDECVPRLLSGCPVLYSLLMARTNKRDGLVVCLISSPVLKRIFINFRGCGGGDLELKINTPALEKIYLSDSLCKHITMEPSSVEEVNFDPPYSSKNTSVELLQAITSVKFLTLHFDAMVAIDRAMERAEAERLETVAESEVERLETVAESEIESAVAMAARATLPRFERLIKLVIQGLEWARWSSLMHLLGSCDRLEHLAIKWFDSCRHVWRDPPRVPRCLLASLKRVTLAGFDGDKEKMAMLKFFLEHGLVMEIVDICCDDITDEKRFEIFNEVSQFPRASPACTISFPDCSEAGNRFDDFEY